MRPRQFCWAGSSLYCICFTAFLTSLTLLVRLGLKSDWSASKYNHRENPTAKRIQKELDKLASLLPLDRLKSSHNNNITSTDPQLSLQEIVDRIHKLADIPVGNWPIYAEYNDLNVTTFGHHEAYRPNNNADSLSLRRTLYAFYVAVRSARDENLVYFMSGGTLIGSYRYHDFIPWDDDIDIIFNASQKEVVRNVLKRLEPGYRLHTGVFEKELWKFYPKDGHVHPSRAIHYRSPFIDIFFFKENATHIWNETPWFPSDRGRKSEVFPLYDRPFGAFMLPAPCDTPAVLGWLYNMNQCEERHYSHILLRVITNTPQTIKCDQLNHLYPFVKRTRTMNYDWVETQEILMFKNRKLGEVRLKSKC